MYYLRIIIYIVLIYLSTYILKYSYYLYIVLIYGLYIKSIQKNPPKLNTRCYISIVFPKDALGKLSYIRFFLRQGKKAPTIFLPNLITFR